MEIKILKIELKKTMHLKDAVYNAEYFVVSPPSHQTAHGQCLSGRSGLMKSLFKIKHNIRKLRFEGVSHETPKIAADISEVNIDFGQCFEL